MPSPVTAYNPLIIKTGLEQQLGAEDFLYGGSLFLVGGNVTKCNPVYVSGAGTVAKAKADALATSKVVGLASTTFGIAGRIQTDGIVSATTAEWDAVTGGSGGLTAGSTYYLSAATAGNLTTTMPGINNYVVAIGIALSACELKLGIQQPMEIGGNSNTFTGPQKNVLINGNFQFWQRGTSLAIATVGAQPITWSADRWYFQQQNVGIGGTLDRSTDVPTANVFAPYSWYLNPTNGDISVASDAFGILSQAIEGVFWSQLKNHSYMTLSFWVKSTGTGVFSTFIMSAAKDWVYVNEHTINSANTWEFKTCTIPYPTSGTWSSNTGVVGAYLGFTLSAGTDFQTTAGAWQNTNDYGGSNQDNFLNGDTVNFAQIQLEAGSTSTQFDLPPYQIEFDRCQRYYWKTFAIDTAPVQNVGSTNGTIICCNPAANTYAIVWVPYPVRMCKTPTITSYNPSAANNKWRDVSSGVDYTFASDLANDRSMRIYAGTIPSAVPDLLAVHLAAEADFS